MKRTREFQNVEYKTKQNKKTLQGMAETFLSVSLVLLCMQEVARQRGSCHM